MGNGVKAPCRLVVNVLAGLGCLCFVALVSPSPGPQERLQSADVPGLENDSSQVFDREWLRLPPFALGAESQTAKTGSQLSAKDTGGRRLSTEPADLLIAAGGGFSRSHRPKVHPALTNRTRRTVRQRRVDGRAAVSTRGWFRQRGQVKVSFDGDAEEYFGWRVDYSQPVYQSLEHVWLFEAGGRADRSGHYQADGGLVYRYGRQNGRILGVNLFLDHGLAAAQSEFLAVVHTRGSVGVEWKLPGWGVGVNAYMPVSQWKQSNRLTHVDPFTDSNALERFHRPARGVDVTFESHLAYVPLSVKISYSCWFSDAIGMAKQGRIPPAPLRENKIFGVIWQPIPLLKFSTNYLLPPGYRQSEWFRAELRINLGKSFQTHFRSTGSESARARSRAVRYQFVDRDREVIVESRCALKGDTGLASDTGLESDKVLEAESDVTKVLCSGSDECPFTPSANGVDGGKATSISKNAEIAKVETTTGSVIPADVDTTRITGTEPPTGEHTGQSDMTVKKSKFSAKVYWSLAPVSPVVSRSR